MARRRAPLPETDQKDLKHREKRGLEQFEEDQRVALENVKYISAHLS